MKDSESGRMRTDTTMQTFKGPRRCQDNLIRNGRKMVGTVGINKIEEAFIFLSRELNQVIKFFHTVRKC